MLDERHFDPVFREIAIQALEYRERHRQAPGTHTIDFFDAAIEDNPDREKLFDRLHKSLAQTADEVNAQYVLDRARAFVRRQNLKRAISTAIRKLEQDDEEGLLEAESTLTDALQETAVLYHPGVRFIEDVDATLSFLEGWDMALPTGIPALDERNLGPARGRLHLFVAPPKAGKSWWMINLATRAHQHALKVLYVSLELGEPELCQRMLQSFFAISKRRLRGLTFKEFIQTDDPGDRGTQFNIRDIGSVLSFRNKDIEKKLKERMAEHRGERMFIREFPTGTLSTRELDGYLDFLENRERFVPDLVLVDYADIMQLPTGLDRWEALIDVTQNLRRIAQERNIAVATASQTKASGAKKSTVDAGDIAGAYDKIATADTVITYSQTNEERRDSQARLYVAAARTEEDRFQIVVSQKYEIGQFAMSSDRLGRHYSPDLKNDREEED